MSSRRASTKPYIFGTKKQQNPAAISPKNPLSSSGLLDTRASIMGLRERINTTEVYRSNSPNRLKDISNSIVNSSIDAKGQQDPGNSKFSFIKMLVEKKNKDISENPEYQKLREEVLFLRQDTENKDKIIEKLVKENQKLQKEMEELQTTVELAKGKITNKLQEYSQRTQQLEAEIKSLREENQTFRDQMYKSCHELPPEQIPGEQANQSENEIFEKLHDSCRQISSEFMNAYNPQRANGSPLRRRVVEQHKDSINSSSQTSGANQGQPKPKRFGLKLADPASPPKVRMITTPARKVPLLGNLEKLNGESYGIAAMQKTMAINTNEENSLLNNPESSLTGHMSPTNLNVFKKSPKAMISPAIRTQKSLKSDIASTETDSK